MLYIKTPNTRWDTSNKRWSVSATRYCEAMLDDVKRTVAIFDKKSRHLTTIRYYFMINTFTPMHRLHTCDNKCTTKDASAENYAVCLSKEHSQVA